MRVRPEDSTVPNFSASGRPAWSFTRERIGHFLFYVLLCAACLAAGLTAGPKLQQAYEHFFPAPAFVEGDFSALYEEEGKPIVMFTASTCPFCRAARELLAREHVDFKELVTDQSPQARAKFIALGGEAVPVLFVGHRRIVGYHEDVILQSIAAARESSR